MNSANCEELNILIEGNGNLCFDGRLSPPQAPRSTPNLKLSYMDLLYRKQLLYREQLLYRKQLLYRQGSKISFEFMLALKTKK